MKISFLISILSLSSHCDDLLMFSPHSNQWIQKMATHEKIDLKKTFFWRVVTICKDLLINLWAKHYLMVVGFSKVERT